VKGIYPVSINNVFPERIPSGDVLTETDLKKLFFRPARPTFLKFLWQRPPGIAQMSIAAEGMKQHEIQQLELTIIKHIKQNKKTILKQIMPTSTCRQ